MEKSMKTSKAIFTMFVTAVVFQACDSCRTLPPPPVSNGEIEVQVSEGGVVTRGPKGTYNFGSVSMGKDETIKMVVQNVGRGVASLKLFEKVSGDPVVAGEELKEAGAIFAVEFTGVEIPPGETKDFVVHFKPPVIDGVKTKDYQSVVNLRADNTPVGKETAEITFVGKAVSGECDLPATIDFGAVARGDTFAQVLQFSNTRPIETNAKVGEIESPQGVGVFAFSADTPRGSFIIGSQKTKTVTINFTPSESRDYVGNVKMQRADGCPEKIVRLIGNGVDQVLTWDPARVDFGYVTPGLVVTREVTFMNKGLKPVAMTAIGALDNNTVSNLFKVSGPGPDFTKATVPAATRVNGMLIEGKTKVSLTCKPVVLGPKQGQLKATTDLKQQGSISLPLQCVGGGADIEIKPSTNINFGRIAYFAGATPPSFAQRKLTVQNVGTLPNPRDRKANLRLGKIDAAGEYVKPYWEVTPANATTSIEELCMGMFDVNTNTCASPNDLPATGIGKYDPLIGLEASGLNAILDIPVRIIPSGLGLKEFNVKIFSNDPDEAVVTVKISGTAVLLPPCNISVTPMALNFGVISPPQTKDIGFTVRNLGTQSSDVCLITNLQLGAEIGTPAMSEAIFSLPAGEIPEKELMPGETMQVLVRAWPKGNLPPMPTQISGRVNFNISNPTAPQGSVPLSATLAPSCLSINPSSLNFGTVQKDCVSPAKTFTVYNTCPTAVVLNSSNIVGGPNEFSAPRTPMLGSLAPAATVSFDLKYAPKDFGPDTGAFRINVTQSGTAVDYIVTLTGQGDTMGLNTDTFRQDSKPKADILLVIDDSGSMFDKQQSLGMNFGSFIQYARNSAVDFNVAVTTTDFSAGTKGQFKAVPNSGEKILTSMTPMLDAKFGALVNVGTNGSGTESCLEGAVLALTAPNITSTNTGFLRPDAVLAVVCVTDAEDQGNSPVPFYLNTLLNVKGSTRAGQFTYNVVGPFLGSAPPGNCSYDEPNPDATKHIAMVNATNGVKEEICTMNWATALENIGKNAFGFRTNFFLTARPDLTNGRMIEVKIDGTVLANEDPVRQSTIWRYDETQNSINFEPTYVPEPGEVLTVTYNVACNQ
jgi:hypothetical protein